MHKFGDLTFLCRMTNSQSPQGYRLFTQPPTPACPNAYYTRRNCNQVDNDDSCTGCGGYFGSRRRSGERHLAMLTLKAAPELHFGGDSKGW